MNANHWTEVGHFYRPIAYYGGKVLKYAGIATEGNKEASPTHWAQEKDPGYLPGVVILPEYLGDRIRADDHTLFTGI